MENTLKPKLQQYFQDKKPETLWSLIKEYGPSSKTWSLQDLLKNKDTFHNDFMKREQFTRYLSWAVPSPEVIQDISNFVGSTPILEINAGRGLWAHLLQTQNVTVIPTDLHPRSPTFTSVIEMDAVKAVKTHLSIDGCLMSVWPDYTASYATEAIKVGLPKLKKVIYIGEEDGGCTGDGEILETLDKHFTLYREVTIPQYWGIHDRMYLYTK